MQKIFQKQHYSWLIGGCFWILWMQKPFVFAEPAQSEVESHKTLSNTNILNTPNQPKDVENSSTIAVVDVEHINDHAAEMQSVRDQANHLRETYQKEIAALEKSLREERLRLDSDKRTLSIEEKESQERIFESKENQLRQLARHRKNQWEQALETAREEFLRKFQSAVAQVAKENHLTIVLVKSAVPYYASSCDITPRILKMLNATSQPVILRPPATEPAQKKR
ncbi:MAG: OmpH family outer membrane protein [Holosporales bacterium]|jgi:Skp family chaperone for outer membrane proteins|nr:OmpH family outer membrane protein [Holosporales bacterium]